MPNSKYPNIDFKFRIGLKEGLDRSSYEDGSLNFTQDTNELVVQKDGLTFSINSIIFGFTENQIRALVSPNIYKLYLSSDTKKLMYFNANTLKWIVFGEVAETADKAIHDSEGNTIADYYYPKDEAIAEHENIRRLIAAIETSVGGVARLDYVVIDSLAALPVTGEVGVIYLVPAVSYFGYEDDPGANDTDSNHYVELLYINDDIYGGYYEVISDTSINLGNFYTKDDVNNLISNLRTQFNNELTVLRTEMLGAINSIRTNVNGIQSSTYNRLNTMESALGTLGGTVSSQGTTLTTLSGDMSTAQGDITDLKSRMTTAEGTISSVGGLLSRMSSAEATIITHTGSISDLETAVGAAQSNITDLQNDVIDLDQRVSALEPPIDEPEPDPGSGEGE